MQAMNEIVALVKSDSPKMRRGSHSEDTEDEDHNLKSGDWLLTSLPNLMHFAVILPQIYRHLIQACLMETNLLCLQNYVLFLTQYVPQEKLYESAIGISYIVVDRFEVVRKLLQSKLPEEKYSASGNIVLGSLLTMFRNAMEKAIHSQTVPQLSSSTEFLLINFTKIGKKAIVHTALIQAVYLLLSCDLPSNCDPNDFKYLLEMWCPLHEKNRPEAYTVESKENTPLPHVQTLPQLLLSSNPTVLDIAIQAASPSQLYIFVQQIGCPKNSMEKVLQALDGICDDHDASNELRRCVDNPVQGIQFVEVHILRGTENGHAFLSFLQGLASIPPTETASDMPSILEQKAPVPLIRLGKPPDTPKQTGLSSMHEISKIPQEQMEQHLLQVFAPSLSRVSVPSSETKKLTLDIKSMLQNLICSNRSSATGSTAESLNSHISGLITALHKFVTGSSIRRQFLEGLIKSCFAVTLLRTITKVQRLNQSEDFSARLFKTTIQHLLSSLESLGQKGTKLKGLKVFYSVVKACAEQLNIKKVLEGNQQVQKLTVAAKDVCKVIREEKDPFVSKSGVMKTCLDVIQANMPSQAESVIKTLVQHSLCTGNEYKCIEFLQTIRESIQKSAVPIALQCNPELFLNSESMSSDSASNVDMSECDLEPMDTARMEINSLLAAKVDLSGLFVDLQDILDPEIFQLCPQSSLRMVFGLSKHMTMTNLSSSESMSAPLSSLLLSGRGYMLTRITNNCSWPTLINTLTAILDSSAANDM